MDEPPAPDDTPIAALDPAAEQIREMAARVADLVAAYHDGLRDRPVYTRMSTAEFRRALAEPPPEEGRDFDRLLEVFRDVLLPGNRHNGHPRFFGDRKSVV